MITFAFVITWSGVKNCTKKLQKLTFNNLCVCDFIINWSLVSTNQLINFIYHLKLECSKKARF